MAKKISASVGKGGKNKLEDVKLVQQMLNEFTKQGGFKKLDEDGLIGPKTNAAIKSFQEKVVGMARADSRIDSGGESFAALSMGPKKVEAEAKKAEKAEEKAAKAEEKKAAKAEQAEAEQSGGKPQVKGDIRGLDKKLVAILEEVSAHYGKAIEVVTGKVSDSGTNLDSNKLWNGWVNKLKRGEKVSALDESTRREMDAFYEAQNLKDFSKLAAKVTKGGSKGGSNDAHATGRAIDLKKNTDSKVVAALETILRREKEDGVIHFDDGGKGLPNKISDSMKKQWA